MNVNTKKELIKEINRITGKLNKLENMLKKIPDENKDKIIKEITKPAGGPSYDAIRVTSADLKWRMTLRNNFN